jgi:hypothetical protein
MRIKKSNNRFRKSKKGGDKLDDIYNIKQKYQDYCLKGNISPNSPFCKGLKEQHDALIRENSNESSDEVQQSKNLSEYYENDVPQKSRFSRFNPFSKGGKRTKRRRTNNKRKKRTRRR